MPNLDYRETNADFFESLMSNDPMAKRAANESLTQFVRLQAREDGVQRRYMPFVQVRSEDLTPQLDSELNVIVCYKEPLAPGAISVPYDTGPIGWHIVGDRFPVTFARVVSSAFMKDVSKLRTYPYDIRQLVSDYSLRDILAQEDSRFFQAVNSVVGTTPGDPSPMTNEVQYWELSGGVSRDSIKEMLKLLPSLPGHLEAKVAITNNVTFKDFLAWGHTEFGGPRSQEILLSGTMPEEFMGVTWLVTIKRHLVSDGNIYVFADPRAVGKAFALEDVTMYVKVEAFRVMWMSYEEIGSAIANGWGVGRVVCT